MKKILLNNFLVVLSIVSIGQCTWMDAQACSNVQVLSLKCDGRVRPCPEQAVLGGQSPSSIAVSPQGTVAAVANSGSNNVSVFCVNSDGLLKLKQTIAAGLAPSSVAFSPDGKMAAVANSQSDNLSVYQVCKGKFIHTQTINVGTNPTSVAFSNTAPIAAVVNRDDKELSTLSVQNGTLSVTGTVAINQDITTVFFSTTAPTGFVTGPLCLSTLLITNNNTVTVVDDEEELEGGTGGFGADGITAVIAGPSISIPGTSVITNLTINPNNAELNFGATISIPGTITAATPINPIIVEGCSDLAAAIEADNTTTQTTVATFGCNQNSVPFMISATAPLSHCPAPSLDKSQSSNGMTSRLAVAFDFVEDCAP